VIRTRHMAAFSLLEMLVALALMSILAGSLYRSFSVGFRCRTHAEAAIAPARAAALALEPLHRDVQSALPPSGILAGAFIGQDAEADVSAAAADTLSFFAMIESAAQDGPVIRKVEFSLVAGADDVLTLVRRVTTNLLAPETPETVEDVLCRNVISFNLRYYDGTDWLDSWDSTVRDNALPLAVETTIAICRGGSPRPPSVRRSDSVSADEQAYRITRVFPLPCGTAPAGDITVESPSP